MTTVQIAYEVPASAVAKIKTLLSETAMRDVNWNGADFVIERDEFTCIPDSDSADAVALLGKINSIIRGENTVGHQTSRGGARAGAGAKPKIEDGKRVQVYLNKEFKAIAADLGNGNVSEGLRRALLIAKNGSTNVDAEALQLELNGQKLSLTRANERWYAAGEKAKKAEEQKSELLLALESMLFDFGKFETDNERLSEFRRLRKDACDIVSRIKDAA